MHIFTPTFLKYSLLLVGIHCCALYGNTFNDYVCELECHPEVGSILAESEKYVELSHGEMGLPDPQLIFGVDNIPIESPAFDRFLPSSKVLGIQQQIPSYGLRKAKSKQQRNRADKQSIIAEYTAQRLRAYLISALVRLNEIDEVKSHLNHKLEYYVELQNYLKGKLEAGNSVYGQFSEIDVERIDVEKQLNDLRSEKVSIESELIRLIGEVPNIDIPSVPVISGNCCFDQTYPALIAMQEVCIAKSGVAVANKAYSPNFGLKALYKQRESGSNFSGDDWFSVQATVSFPIWSHWNQAPKLRSAQAAKRSADFDRENVIREWRKKLTVLASERDTALGNISLLSRKKTAIYEVIAAAERDYEAGNAELSSILRARIDGLTVAIQMVREKSRHIRLSAEYNSYFIKQGTI